MKKSLVFLPFLFVLGICGCANSSDSSQAEESPAKVVVQPGEQAPLADPGQNNFGGPAAQRDARRL